MLANLEYNRVKLTDWLGPPSGSMFLRQSSNSFSINIRSSYNDEAAAIVGYINRYASTTFGNARDFNYGCFTMTNTVDLY